MKKGSAYFSRALCTQIFVEYVEAYLHTIKTQQYNIPTIMFVMQEKGKKKPDPSVVPHELKRFDDEAIESAAADAVSYANHYNLDLIMYCNFEDGYKKKEDFGITFACRDAMGNTVHQMYRFNTKTKKVLPRPIIPGHNKWLPPTGKHERFPDPILTKIATNYSLILAENNSMNSKK